MKVRTLIGASTALVAVGVLAGCSGSPEATPTATVTVTASASPQSPTIEKRDNVVGGTDELPLLGKPQAYNVGDIIDKIKE